MTLLTHTRRLGPAGTVLATTTVASIAAASLVAMSAMAFEPARLDVVDAIRVGAEDAGIDAVPLEQYLAGLQPAPDERGAQVANDALKFPLVSALRRGVLAGPVAGVMPARWMGSPVFVLGADEVSAQWLRHNLRALHAMRAMGLVVQADNARVMGALQGLGDGLPLAPARSPWLQRRLIAVGVNVYPVLIQADGSVVQIVPSVPGGDEAAAVSGVVTRQPAHITQRPPAP
jgi:integrating conjugative element protein (TIGR03765 family)